MAKEVTLRCDICKKPTRRIVAKLHYIPMNGLSRSAHSNYTHRADVGECCKERLLTGFNFRMRMTRSEYEQARRDGTMVQ